MSEENTVEQTVTETSAEAPAVEEKQAEVVASEQPTDKAEESKSFISDLSKEDKKTEQQAAPVPEDYKDLGIADDGVQLLVDNNIKPDTAKQLLAYQEQVTKDLYDSMYKEIEADAEIQKDMPNLNSNISKAIARFGGEGFSEIFNNPAYGNNLQLVKFLNNVGKYVSEEKGFVGNGAVAEDNSTSTIARQMFPNSLKDY